MSMSTTSKRLPRLKSRSQDNQVLTLTRFVGAFIVPVLTLAFGMLYLFPARSGELFAWPIRPSMSAMMLGAAYIGGAYYFTRVFVAKKWNRIKLGLLPVTTFASFLGITTLLHWDKFTAGHPSFIMWAILYLTLPFLLPVVWWLNRSADPLTLEEGDHYLPQALQRFFLLMGGFLFGVSLILLLAPDILIEVWPWTLSQLTARVMGAMFVLPGLVGLGVWMDKRWSSARIILQSQIFSMVMILLAMLFSRGDFDWSQPKVWLFAVSMTGLCLGLIGIYIRMERR